MAEEKNLSPLLARLIQDYWQAAEKSRQKKQEATVNVDEIASKLAVFYERVRKVVDWKEENLIRRSAIERYLRRQLVGEISQFSLKKNINSQEVAETIVADLVRGGYLKNGQVPQSKVGEVKNILERYLFLLNLLSRQVSEKEVKERVNQSVWLFSQAACEIEKTLDPSFRQDLLINFMFDSLKTRLRLDPQLKIEPQEAEVQLYIAVCQSLFSLDEAEITSRLLPLYYPQWQNPDESLNIRQIKEEIAQKFNHPLAGQWQKICRQEKAIFLILSDIFKEKEKEAKNFEEFWEQFAVPDNFQAAVEEAYQKRFSTLKSRLFRTAIYSTLSILIASLFSLLILEFPLAKLIYGQFLPLAMAIDILIPTLLMFLLVALIRPPKEENYQRLEQKIFQLAYEEGGESYFLKPSRPQSLLNKSLFAFLYLLVATLGIGLIVGIFYFAKVPPTSIILDTINVAMIIFAALSIRQSAKEIDVDEKESFFEFFLDTLFVPVGRLGQWFSQKWREYNVASVFLSVLVDLPFSSLVTFVEDWRAFLREKQAGIH